MAAASSNNSHEIEISFARNLSLFDATMIGIGAMFGADPELDPRFTPGKDPKLRGGNRLNVLAGFSWYLNEGSITALT